MYKFLFYFFLLLTFSCQEKAQILINPEHVIIGDNIDIQVVDLEPNTEYDLYLTKLTLKDEFAMYSKATFLSNAEGKIDIDQDESLGGTFLGKDSLGLFYSIDTQSVVPNFLVFDEDLSDRLNAYRRLQVIKDDKLIVDKQFKLIMYDSTDVVHTHIEEERVKLDLFQANESNNLIVVLGGSEGDNKASIWSARDYANLGYNTAAISYFGIGSQGYNLINIPLERIDTSIMMIEEKMGKIDKLYIMGASRGAELALLYASLRPKVNVVMAFAPSCVPMSAYSAHKSAWTLNGNSIGFLDFEFSGKVEVNKHGQPIYTPWYLTPLNNMNDSLMIKVENIQGDIFLFSGEDDDLWPASIMAGMMEKRIDSLGFDYNLYNYKYKNAGHYMMGAPYLPVTGIGKYATGGQDKENAYALLKNCEIIDDYLEKNFK